MTIEEYEKNIKALVWAKHQIDEVIALLYYKRDNMLKNQTNKNRVICGLETAIESLKNVQEEIKVC